MGGMGLIFTPVLVRRLLRPSSRVWAYNRTTAAIYIEAVAITCLMGPYDASSY